MVCCEINISDRTNAKPPVNIIAHIVFQRNTFNNTGAYRKEQDDISLEEILEMRGSVVGWAFLCQHLLPAVVGNTTWDQKVAVQKVPEFTTVSDVAFCLLALENNWDYWVKVASVEDDSSTRTTFPTTKWTSSPVMSGKNTGWSKEGLERFNDWHGLSNATHPRRTLSMFRTIAWAPWLGKRTRNKPPWDGIHYSGAIG